MTVDGETRVLPRPFMIIATQNPVEYEGTFPLPEAQLDRFAVRVAIGYPPPATRPRCSSTWPRRDPLDAGRPGRRRGAAILAARAVVERVHADPALARYVVALVGGHPPRPARPARREPARRPGAAARRQGAGRCSRAAAYVAARGRPRAGRPPCSSHRLILTPDARARGVARRGARGGRARRGARPAVTRAAGPVRRAPSRLARPPRLARSWRAGASGRPPSATLGAGLIALPVLVTVLVCARRRGAAVRAAGIEPARCTRAATPVTVRVAVRGLADARSASTACSSVRGRPGPGARARPRRRARARADGRRLDARAPVRGDHRLPRARRRRSRDPFGLARRTRRGRRRRTPAGGARRRRRSRALPLGRAARRGTPAARRRQSTRASASSTACATTRPATRSRASTGRQTAKRGRLQTKELRAPDGLGAHGAAPARRRRAAGRRLRDRRHRGGRPLPATWPAAASPSALVAHRPGADAPARAAARRGRRSSSPSRASRPAATARWRLALRAEATASDAPDLIVVVTCGARRRRSLRPPWPRRRATGAGVAAVLVGPAAAPPASSRRPASRWRWCPAPDRVAAALGRAPHGAWPVSPRAAPLGGGRAGRAASWSSAGPASSRTPGAGRLHGAGPAGAAARRGEPRRRGAGRRRDRDARGGGPGDRGDRRQASPFALVALDGDAWSRVAGDPPRRPPRGAPRRGCRWRSASTPRSSRCSTLGARRPRRGRRLADRGAPAAGGGRWWSSASGSPTAGPSSRPASRRPRRRSWRSSASRPSSRWPAERGPERSGRPCARRRGRWCSAAVGRGSSRRGSAPARRRPATPGGRGRTGSSAAPATGSGRGLDLRQRYGKLDWPDDAAGGLHGGAPTAPPAARGQPGRLRRRGVHARRDRRVAGAPGRRRDRAPPWQAGDRTRRARTSTQRVTLRRRQLAGACWPPGRPRRVTGPFSGTADLVGDAICGGQRRSAPGDRYVVRTRIPQPTPTELVAAPRPTTPARCRPGPPRCARRLGADPVEIPLWGSGAAGPGRPRARPLRPGARPGAERGGRRADAVRGGQPHRGLPAPQLHLRRAAARTRRACPTTPAGVPREAPPPLVDFLLDSRRGFCQHFAGAMAVMLRTLGIPARVAVGYTGGRFDPGVDRYVVLDRDAHSWVEVWFPGHGWLPFDPTPGRSAPNPASVSSPDYAPTPVRGRPGRPRRPRRRSPAPPRRPAPGARDAGARDRPRRATPPRRPPPAEGGGARGGGGCSWRRSALLVVPAAVRRAAPRAGAHAAATSATAWSRPPASSRRRSRRSAWRRPTPASATRARRGGPRSGRASTRRPLRARLPGPLRGRAAPRAARPPRPGGSVGAPAPRDPPPGAASSPACTSALGFRPRRRDTVAG